jgi:hypothetical protein
MSDLGLPENRPALAWVASLEAEMTTPSERLLLIALALDSYDGRTCAPGRDALMGFCGIRHVRTFQRLRDSLTKPNEERPALIAADVVKGRHTRYRFLPDSEPLTGGDSEPLSGQPNMSARVDSESLSGDESPNLSAQPVSTSCQHDMSAVHDSDSLSHPSLPLPTLREGERKGEALAAPPPPGGARSRLTVAEVRDTITAVVPAVAVNGVDCSNPDLSAALAQAQASGWTTDLMAAALADMPAPKKSATGQVIARLRDLAGKDPEAIILGDSTPPAPSDRRETSASADVMQAKPAKVTPTPLDAAFVLAGDQRRPGPQGFGHCDPPGRAKPLTSEEQAERKAADDLERQRQMEALARLTRQETTT